MSMIFLFVFLLNVLIGSMNLYPIPAEPLRILVEKSELIAYGNVIKIVRQKSNSQTGEYSVAKLVPSTILKGDIKSDTISIRFLHQITCPAPPHFPLNAKVLVFLTDEGPEDEFSTVALSYGAKIQSKKVFAKYKDRIEELIQIQYLQDSISYKEAISDWLVRTALITETRNDAILDYNIQIHKDQLFFINEYHEELIVQEFLKIEYINGNDLKLLDLLQEKSQEQVYKHLVDYFSRINWKENVIHTQNVIEYIAKFSNSSELKNLATEITRIHYYQYADKMEELDEMISDFTILIGKD